MNRISVRLLAGLIFFISSCSTVGGLITRVRKGAFQATIHETGELQALRAKIVTMPSFDFDYGHPKIISLEKEGLTVKQGDIVGQVDASSVERVLKQKESDLAIARADMQKLLVEQESAIKQLEANLKSAEASLNRARVNVQRQRFESITKQQVAQLELQMAEISFQKAQEKIEHTRNIQKEELLIQQEQIKQIYTDIDKAKRTIELCTLRAPADGIIEYKSRGRRRSEKIKVGDELHPGEPIIGLPDLRDMKVLTTINETDIDKVYTGQSVQVRLDAYPKKLFPGEIIYISKTCRDKDRDSNIKVFDVDVLVKESNPILRPGMTVSCEIVVADLEDALYVDNNCIQRDKNGYFVYVSRGSGTRKINVELGPRNSKSVVVYGDLEEGDRILIAEPAREA